MQRLANTCAPVIPGPLKSARRGEAAKESVTAFGMRTDGIGVSPNSCAEPRREPAAKVAVPPRNSRRDDRRSFLAFAVLSVTRLISMAKLLRSICGFDLRGSRLC